MLNAAGSVCQIGMPIYLRDFFVGGLKTVRLSRFSKVFLLSHTLLSIFCVRFLSLTNLILYSLFQPTLSTKGT
jgi:hypothetical protein